LPPGREQLRSRIEAQTEGATLLAQCGEAFCKPALTCWGAHLAWEHAQRRGDGKAEIARMGELIPQVDELRGRQKTQGKPTPEQVEELKQVKEDLRRLEDELAAAEVARAHFSARDDLFRSMSGMSENTSSRAELLAEAAADGVSGTSGGAGCW